MSIRQIGRHQLLVSLLWWGSSFSFNLHDFNFVANNFSKEYLMTNQDQYWLCSVSLRLKFALRHLFNYFIVSKWFTSNLSSTNTYRGHASKQIWTKNEAYGEELQKWPFDFCVLVILLRFANKASRVDIAGGWIVWNGSTFSISVALNIRSAAGSAPILHKFLTHCLTFLSQQSKNISTKEQSNFVFLPFCW